MAFDAGMLRAVLSEIARETDGARLDKIYQPSSDEVTMTFRVGRESRRLILNASSSAPRVTFSDLPRENPAAAPMFCMLLRKHLAGARLISVEQLGFERAARFRFSGYDEMGYAAGRSIIAEVMGKYSNLMLLDGDDRIIAVLRPVDFSISRLRQLLPGMIYELPPAQDKASPIDETEEGFSAKYDEYPKERPIEKFITSSYLGTASQVAREIAMRAAGSDSATLEGCSREALWRVFRDWFAALRSGNVRPVLVQDRSGAPLDFSYAEMTYRGESVTCQSFAELFDRFYAERDRRERTKQRASDLLRLLSGAESRLVRKLSSQREELAEAEGADGFRRAGEAIVASIWKLSRGDKIVYLPDYSIDPPEDIRVELDPRRSPSENAERYFKLYRKAKRAKEILSEQIAQSEEELAYLGGVRSFLDRADCEQDLLDLRDELWRAGYASRMKNYNPKQKSKPSRPIEAETPGGYRLLIGRNNLQNDHLTFSQAERGDLWFHAKGVPGSHVILVCHGEEPSAEDYTYAAELAAGYSGASSGAGQVAVDYTRVSSVKKPAGARPGYVIYKTNYTAYVTPKKLGEK